MRNKRFPNYPDDADYTTNAPSYYDDLARKQKLIELLAKKIWEYEETLDLTLEEISIRLESYINANDDVMRDRLEQWDLIIENFPENVELLLQEWLSDGTLDHIINDTIFNWKLDTTIFEQFRDATTAQLQQTNQQKLDRVEVIEADENEHGINVSVPNLKNVIYENLFIDVPKYGILWNNGTVGGENLRITKSRIHSEISDPIEINTWGLSNETDFFKNILITDNFISTGITGGSSAGFGIGAASPQNLIVANNVLSQSSNEGIHIEGLARNTIISNNIIDNALGDGITIAGDLNEQSLVEPTTVSNNAIRSGVEGEGTGINLVYSTSTVKGLALLHANKIIGFNRGISYATPIDVSGTYIQDCNQALNAYMGGSEVVGLLRTKNTPRIINIEVSSSTIPSHFEGFYTDDLLNIDNIITKPTNSFLTLNKMSYRVALAEKDIENYTTTNIVAVPKYFKGIIKLFSQNSGNRATYIAHCEIVDGVLSATPILRDAAGSYGNISIALNGGYVTATHGLNTLPSSGQHMRVSLNGDMLY